MSENHTEYDGFTVVDLNFVSLYVEAFDEAITFYSSIFGKPQYSDSNGLTLGWRMGHTWLTLFPAKYGTEPGRNPCNSEFAIQVAAPAEVDVLYDKLIAAGSATCIDPCDTTMYDRMRYAAVDDPYGVRIDVYCPLPE